jgi:hypothetical protein
MKEELVALIRTAYGRGRRTGFLEGLAVGIAATAILQALLSLYGSG